MLHDNYSTEHRPDAVVLLIREYVPNSLALWWLEGRNSSCILFCVQNKVVFAADGSVLANLCLGFAAHTLCPGTCARQMDASYLYRRLS